LSYRVSPLLDAESYLIGTTQHSVLGTRGVYDACGDPCYLDAVTGSTGPLHSAAPGIGSLTARSVDAGTVVGTGKLEVLVVRRLELAEQHTGTAALTGIWAGQQTPVQLAAVKGLRPGAPEGGAG
jgi:hypothetical protein